MSCGADTEANDLIDSLTQDSSFTVPDIDLDDPKFDLPSGSDSALYHPINPITIEEFTSGIVGGDGVFDKIMTTLSAHLKAEYQANRITAGEYTKAYIAITEAALAQAVQFTLMKNSNFWESVQAQIAAITGRVQLQTARIQAAGMKMEAHNQRATYARTKMELSTASMNYCNAKFNLDNILPAQKTLLQEQMEAQRSQTLDVRTDNKPVTGVMGKQKDLYAQQITSYQRDSEIKTGKLFTDAWITQKTMDEGLVAPPNFQNASLDSILGKLKSNNGLG